MKYKYKILICFSAQLLFDFIRRFVFMRKDPYFPYEITDFMGNGANYLDIRLTSTMHTMIFAAIFALLCEKIRVETLIRRSRTRYMGINLLHSIWIPAVYSLIFCLPHLVFMLLEYDLAALREIQFATVYTVQWVAYVLFYMLTAQLFLFFYYNTGNGVLSSVYTFFVNAVLFFAMNILQMTPPAFYVMVGTRHYWGGVSLTEIIQGFVFIVIPTVIFAGVNLYTIKKRDVLL